MVLAARDRVAAASTSLEKKRQNVGVQYFIYDNACLIDQNQGTGYAVGVLNLTIFG